MFSRRPVFKLAQNVPLEAILKFCLSHRGIQLDIMDSGDAERAKLAADADKELTRLWRAWRTIHQMCQDRVEDPRYFRVTAR